MLLKLTIIVLSLINTGPCYVNVANIRASWLEAHLSYLVALASWPDVKSLGLVLLFGAHHDSYVYSVKNKTFKHLSISACVLMFETKVAMAFCFSHVSAACRNVTSDRWLLKQGQIF